MFHKGVAIGTTMWGDFYKIHIWVNLINLFFSNLNKHRNYSEQRQCHVIDGEKVFERCVKVDLMEGP